jgi:lipopolysaccharide heptosyltransferase II
MYRGDKCKKILCVRLDNLGDLLMTTPAIRALKETDPAREITLLTSSKSTDATMLIPEIDHCIVYDAPWMKLTAPRSGRWDDFEIIQRLKDEQFDAAIIFTVFSQNPLPAAMMCYLAEIPKRLAYCHENPYQLLTDWIKDPDPNSDGEIRHEVQRQLDLVAAIGSYTADPKMSLETPWEAKESVISRLKEKDIDLSDPFVVIHPGASASSRRYPADKFTQVASSLSRELGCQLVFTGSKEERPTIERIQNNLDVMSASFIGSLDLGELAALISLASVIVTNNTAPAHIASAVGTPVVDLYALTNPQHTPWLVPNRVLFHDVPCKYCFKSECPQGHHQCLDLVACSDVVRAVKELLGEDKNIVTDIITPN